MYLEGWRKSSHSAMNGNCVEVAAYRLSRRGRHVVHVRDSKDPAGPILAFSPQAWAEFVARVKQGN